MAWRTVWYNYDGLAEAGNVMQTFLWGINRMARPKKYNIDTKQIQKLASFGCTNIEMADFFGCSPDLLKEELFGISQKRAFIDENAS